MKYSLILTCLILTINYALGTKNLIRQPINLTPSKRFNNQKTTITQVKKIDLPIVCHLIQTLG